MEGKPNLMRTSLSHIVPRSNLSNSSATEHTKKGLISRLRINGTSSAPRRFDSSGKEGFHSSSVPNLIHKAGLIKTTKNNPMYEPVENVGRTVWNVPAVFPTLGRHQRRVSKSES